MYIFLYVTTAVYFIFQILYIIIPIVVSKVKPLQEGLSEHATAVLVPAYNEEKTIENCVEAMLEVDYSNHEIIFINDGSKDNTLQRLSELLDLVPIERTPAGELQYKSVKQLYQSKKHPHFFVIDKVNGGKADSLNAGIDYATGDIVVTLDADSMLERYSLKYVSQYFHNDEVIALGGTVKIVQGAERDQDGRVMEKFKGPGLIKSQILNYMHGFYVRKLTQSFFNSIVVISGAFGAFKRDIMYKTGGFRSTVGEDIDITLKIHQYIRANHLKKKLIYAPEAVCYTECPENLKNFYKQRIRWQKAFVDCILLYWSKLSHQFSPGISLFFAIDGFLLGTLTAFTMIFYVVNALISGEHLLRVMILLFITLLINALQIIISIYLSEKYGSRYSIWDKVKLFVFSQLEMLTYRNVLLYINIVGTFKYFDTDESWGFIERKGTASISQQTAASSQ
ncbi:glycosyltransferase family 2 protein [Paenibacillus sp. 1001270B_150601_E10]|uniref:glycosyltransferase family 2 protein n=1 Tax=Paenibacillus sp. 1001270B_150601_E10 TaxID=2787079 RepID=UPI00189F149D|nr:glycosyltransferase [Paenibacillus sp. 1001270B_150601_E10]